MADTIKIIVVGKAQPRGSKVTQPIYDKVGGKMKPRIDANGRVMSYMRDDNPASGPWMKRVATEAKLAMGTRRPTIEPVILTIDCYLERPQYHFGTGRNAEVLKDRYVKQRHTVRPDRLKLARAIEDALTGIVYVDDAQTVDGPVRKHYVTPGELPRVEILVDVIESGNTTGFQGSLLEAFHDAEQKPRRRYPSEVSPPITKEKD